jgi:hypothetical protein
MTIIIIAVVITIIIARRNTDIPAMVLPTTKENTKAVVSSPAADFLAANTECSSREGFVVCPLFFYFGDNI